MMLGMMKRYLRHIFCFTICFLVSYSAVLPASEKPDWVEKGIVYSLFIRDFSPSGTIKGATEKLEKLKELGVTIIWLLPVHPIGQAKRKGTLGSPYSIQDYHAINPDYGSKEDLKNFVARAHQLGFKVIMDAVLNHTAWDNKLIKERPEFYKKDENQRIIAPLPEWKDVAALDYNNPELRQYMIQLLKYWLQEFDVDGFRFDAASFVPLDFWKQAQLEIRNVKPDVFLLGEQDNPEALKEAFDADYDWDFEKVLNDVITNGAHATASFKSFFDIQNKTFPKHTLHLRFSDNHDKKRAIARFGEKGALAATALIFTLDGIPLVYNGMEFGDTTESTDPALFEKMPIFWGTVEIRPEFLDFYEKMIALRKGHEALRKGYTLWLKNSDESRILTFLRKGGKEELLVAINLSNRPSSGAVELKTPKNFANITPFNNDASKLPELELKPWEFQIFAKPSN